MIKANELRIGNLVYLSHESNNSIATIHQIGDDNANTRKGIWTDYELLEPIPLTPEWLERMGFVKYAGNTGVEIHKFPIGRSALVPSSSREEFIYSVSDYQGGYLYQTPIKYVHQLQNLYFALTGEEITIKELA